MRTLATPEAAEPWSLTSLREKLIKIGAKGVSHGRYVTFQMAEIALPRQMFADILSLIAGSGYHPRPHEGQRHHMLLRMTAELCLDACKSALFSGSLQSPLAFRSTAVDAACIYLCRPCPKSTMVTANHPESGECQLIV
jgi:hypothetical protein